MTSSQYLTLKSDILAKSATVYSGATLATHMGNSNFSVIADYYNSTAAPVTLLWRPDITVSDMTNIIDMAEYVLLSVAKQNAWMAMSQGRIIDATLSQVRTNFVTIFGSGTNTTIAATAMAQKEATNFEKLFTTNGVCSVYKVLVTASDIIQAIRS